MDGYSSPWVAMISALSSDGNTEGVEYALKLWRAEKPDDAEIDLYEAGFKYLGDQLQDAEMLVNRFLEKFPDDLRAVMLKYTILAQQSKDEAKEIIRHAQEVAENRGDEWYAFGIFMMHLSNLDAAIRYLRKAIVFQPENPKIWSGIGFAYIRNREYERAKEAYSRAGEFSDERQNVVRFGTLELFMGHIDRAIEIFEKNIEMDENNPILWNNFGLAYFLRERYEDAQKCWEKVLEINSYFPYAHYNIACLNSRLGNFDVAFEHLKRAVEFGSYFKKVAVKDGDFRALINHPSLGDRVKKILSE